MPPVRIPAGAFVPPICPRHGRPATSMRPMVFLSPLPLWAWPLAVLAGRLLYRILLRPLRKEALAPAWPSCHRCGLRRAARIAAGAATIVAGLVAALYLSERVHGTAALAAIAVTVACMGAGLIVVARGTRVAVAGVRVSRDGLWLEPRRPHPAFVAALAAQPLPEYPMPAGWTVPATAAPSAAWATVQPAAEPVPVPSAAPPPVPSHSGWTSPSG
ncbi:hypothetical protein GCM10009827_032690 [Dactylosporangium maewongense]|uniref:Integral membrane protein n=1 Tax=Dactylosporangium maewongense TaxID=634393 RepID=A0ABN2ABA6_9ACTN